jgi:hypothetical protein
MSKHVGLSAAIGLVGVGIILNALPKFGIGTPAAIAAPLAPVAQAGAPAPTIVWYGVAPSTGVNGKSIMLRAWSNGTVELMAIDAGWNGLCGGDPNSCASAWEVISSPIAGLSAAADTNFDQEVDGADLANLLAAWGPAPRSPIPPSDCPLNLINP